MAPGEVASAEARARVLGPSALSREMFFAQDNRRTDESRENWLRPSFCFRCAPRAPSRKQRQEQRSPGSMLQLLVDRNLTPSE